MTCRPLSCCLAIALAGCYDEPTLPEDETSGTPTTTSAPQTTSGVDDGASDDPAASGPMPSDDSTSSPPATDTGTPIPTTDDGSDAPVAMCGNGVREDGEDCDDANMDPADLCAPDCTLETLEFAYTGDVQSFMIPAWVTGLRIEAWGAQGAHANCCEGPPVDTGGGRGGYVTGSIDVTPGSEILVYVGGQGVAKGAGGWNGGGAAGQWAAGGGGATDLRLGGDTLDHRVLVAGGGGGSNCGCPPHGTGGAGGGLDGAPGTSNNGFPIAGGGSQLAGGVAGDAATPGDLGIGGTAIDPANNYHVAGGGGGYYGGGGAFGAGGGGGSSYVGELIQGATVADVREGDGLVTLIAVEL